MASHALARRDIRPFPFSLAGGWGIGDGDRSKRGGAKTPDRRSSSGRTSARSSRQRRRARACCLRPPTRTIRRFPSGMARVPHSPFRLPSRAHAAAAHTHIDTCLPACSYRMHIGTVRTLCTDEAKGKGKKDKKGQRQKRKKKTKKKEDGTRGKENKDKGERKCQSGPVRKRGRAGGRRASHFLFADSYVLIMYAMPCHAMPCHAVPCNAMQCTGVDSPPPPFSPRVLIRPKLGRRRPLNASTER